MMPAVNMSQVQAIVQRSDGIMTSAQASGAAPDWLTKGGKRAAVQSELPTRQTLMQQSKNDLDQYAAQYAAMANDSAQSWLRTRIHGVPVVPPNLRGRALQEYVDHTLMAKEEAQAKTLVFISMDMPHAILRHWFAVVAGNRHLFENTVFVLRGWPSTPEGLPHVIEAVNKLMPSFKKTANVEINPIQFTDHNVHDVPVIVHQAPNGVWSAIVGDRYGLRRAIARIDAGKGNPHAVDGEVWKIAEPNMIRVFKQRIKTFNWKKAEQEGYDHAWNRAKTFLGDSLPDSRRGRNYTYNPSVVATSTIHTPSGQVLVHRGQEIDPLTTFPFPWTQSYIVFNPAQAWQVNQVQAWASTFPNVVIMASQLPASWQAENALVNRLGHPIYGIWPELAQRLGINRVPALIQPDGKVLHITVPREPLVPRLGRN